MGEHVPDFEAARPHLQSLEHQEGEEAANVRSKIADGLVWLEVRGVELPEDIRLFMERYRTRNV